MNCQILRQNQTNIRHFSTLLCVTGMGGVLNERNRLERTFPKYLKCDCALTSPLTPIVKLLDGIHEVPIATQPQ